MKKVSDCKKWWHKVAAARVEDVPDDYVRRVLSAANI